MTDFDFDPILENPSGRQSIITPRSKYDSCIRMRMAYKPVNQIEFLNALLPFASDPRMLYRYPHDSRIGRGSLMDQSDPLASVAGTHS